MLMHPIPMTTCIEGSGGRVPGTRDELDVLAPSAQTIYFECNPLPLGQGANGGPAWLARKQKWDAMSAEG